MKHLLLVALLVATTTHSAEEFQEQNLLSYNQTISSWAEFDNHDFLDQDFEIVLTQPNQYNWSQADKYCMARNIFHEAANEPVEGQVAVAVVTMNRVKDSEYPNDVCGVVYQRGRVPVKQKGFISKATTKIVCQFSWTCERVKLPRAEDIRWQNILQLVEDFANNKYTELEEKYRESFHYHAYYVNPGWRIKRLWQTGAHIFYTR